jgi:hypothetical protein
MGQNIPDCLSRPWGSIAGCSRDREAAVVDDPPTVLATRAMAGRVPLVDLNDLICGAGTCSPVVGDVLVYRDVHHLSRTYVLTLEPYLDRRLTATGAMDSRLG